MQRQRPAHPLFALLVAWPLLLSPAGAQPDSHDPAAADDEGPPIVVEVLGGLCPYGACYTRLEIESDGSWLLAEGFGDPVAEVGGRLDQDLFDALRSLIASADFEALRSRPVAAICPTAGDGPRYVYTFVVAEEREHLDSCESDLDGVELSDTLRALLVELYRQSR